MTLKVRKFGSGVINSGKLSFALFSMHTDSIFPIHRLKIGFLDLTRQAKIDWYQGTRNTLTRKHDKEIHGTYSECSLSYLTAWMSLFSRWNHHFAAF